MYIIKLLVLIYILLTRTGLALTCDAFNWSSWLNCIDEANNSPASEFTIDLGNNVIYVETLSTINNPNTLIKIQHGSLIGDNSFTILEIEQDAKVELFRIHISKGGGNYGAIANYGYVSLYECELYDNHGSNSVAIYNAGDLHIENSIINDNINQTMIYESMTAVIFNLNKAYIKDSIIINNIAFLGSIYSYNYISIDNTNIINNMSYVATVFIDDSYAQINESEIAENMSMAGGGIFLYDAIVEINHSVITGNLASAGSGISCEDSEVLIFRSFIEGNYADQIGGGIYSKNCFIFLEESSISSNIANDIDITNNVNMPQWPSLKEAALHLPEGVILPDLHTDKSNHDDLYADDDNDGDGDGIYSDDDNDGGGLYIDDGSDVVIYASTIANNYAHHNGGGIYKAQAVSMGIAIEIYNSTISSNHVHDEGGGIYMDIDSVSNDEAVVNMTNNTIAFNEADDDGGGIYLAQPLTLDSFAPANIKNFISNIVADNEAEDDGDDIYVDGAILFGTTVTHNLIGNTSNTNSSQWSDTSNITNTDPLLEPLADNGGPTFTHALALLSPALNKGANPGDFSNDQRSSGYKRVFGSQIDIGSFEWQDKDSDGIEDGIDNCPDIFNPNQSDSNNDGIGNVCTPDRVAHGSGAIINHGGYYGRSNSWPDNIALAPSSSPLVDHEDEDHSDNNIATAPSLEDIEDIDASETWPEDSYEVNDMPKPSGCSQQENYALIPYILVMILWRLACRLRKAKYCH